MLQKLITYLNLAQHVYLVVFSRYICDEPTKTSDTTPTPWLVSEIHSLFSQVLPMPMILRPLKKETKRLLVDMLFEITKDSAISLEPQKDGAPSGYLKNTPLLSTKYQYSAQSRLEALFSGLRSVGLIGGSEQILLADVLNEWMTEAIQSFYSIQLEFAGHVAEKIKQWSGAMLAPTVRNLRAIFDITEEPLESEPYISPIEPKMGDMAFARLGSLHVAHLFDVVAHKEYRAVPLDSLRSYATTPLTRFYLTSTFNAKLVRKLLQPGISTLEILRVYIAMIRVFRKLDPRAVLLDRVARPIRRFLREREDTAKIIVSGLMTDPGDTRDQHAANTGMEVYLEISTELTKVQTEGLELYKGELDWDDMTWMPDPVDAAPDYKRSASFDIIGSLISLFENKETFVAELQKLLSERLLQRQGGHAKVKSLLQLLKARFGETVLQACEVMLRDIIESRTLDMAIHDERSDIVEAVPDNFHSRVLSYMYWPRLSSRTFKVPATVRMAQETYARMFEVLKISRKLTWVQFLGRAVVELEFDDRKLRDEVATWQASVIFAFQSDVSGGPPMARSVGDLSEELEMPPSLVRSACNFWVAKRVLKEMHHDTFQVLDSLEQDDSSTGEDVLFEKKDTDKAAEAATAEADAEAEAEEATSKMELYWKFIVGMLTNQGSMPLNQIIMMLKIVVPGGFPFSNDELRDFLGRMVSRGKLEYARGGAYKLVAK